MLHQAPNKGKREAFFNGDLPRLLPTTECEFLLAGDFNCIIRKDESSENRNISSSLEKLIRGYQLQDAWGQTAENRGYTYYTTTGASRLDRIYISQSMRDHKKGIEIHAAAFTDHMAVTIHLASNCPLQTHGRELWCMNLTMLQDTEYMKRVRELWTVWRTKQKYYPTITLWWERCVKRNLRMTNMRYGSEKKKDTNALENFYYEAIYNIISAPMQHETKAIHLRHLKAKITRLHHYEGKKRLKYTDDGDHMEDEEPTLFQYIKVRKKNKALNITQIKDMGNQIQTDPREILQAFTDSYQKRFETIPVRNEDIQKMKMEIPDNITRNSQDTQDAPITMGELKHSIRKGKLHKSPGADGIGHDFYVKTWDMVKEDLLQLINAMFLEGKTTEAKRKGS
jgi:hypothetical protein